MRDRFNYGAPFGPLGRLEDRLFLTAYMRRLLEARNRELKVVAESERWVRYLPREPTGALLMAVLACCIVNSPPPVSAGR